MYRIAKYLSLEQRRRAAAATYTPTVKGRLFPRTEQLACALAVAAGLTYSPGPSELTTALTGLVWLAEHDVESPEHADVYAAVNRFITDFDNGKIVDVARAMGVKRPT